MIKLIQYFNFYLAQIFLEFILKLNIILLSDHGMTNVSPERIIILDDYIGHLDEYVLDGIGSHVQFYLNNIELQQSYSLHFYI